MKALILAAGKGTRLMPLTRDCPKPMLRILDTPVLELMIERLRNSGVTEIMINTSYKSQAIEHYFGDGSRYSVSIAYSYEGYLEDGQLVGMPVGSAGAIRKIHDHAGFFNETFLVLCGDAIIDVDYAELVEQHHRNRALATIALAEVPHEEVCHYGIVVQNEAGMITGFQEKPTLDEASSNLANTGVYVFEPQIVGCIGREWPIDLGSNIFPMLVREGLPLFGAKLPITWLDIGKLPDYYRVCQLALEGKVPGLRLPGREIARGLRTGVNVRINPRRCEITGSVVIAGGARIEDGAIIAGPCYIGAGAVIAAGATIEQSIVLPHARIGSNAHLKGVVTDGEFCITPNGDVINLNQAKMEWIIGDARMHETVIEMAEQRFLDSIH